MYIYRAALVHLESYDASCSFDVWKHHLRLCIQLSSTVTWCNLIPRCIALRKQHGPSWAVAVRVGRKRPDRLSCPTHLNNGFELCGFAGSDSSLARGAVPDEIEMSFWETDEFFQWQHGEVGHNFRFMAREERTLLRMAEDCLKISEQDNDWEEASQVFYSIF